MDARTDQQKGAVSAVEPSAPLSQYPDADRARTVFWGDAPGIGTSSHDEPQGWRELAEAAISDLGRYARDAMPERRLVSFEAYKERAKALGGYTQAEGRGTKGEHASAVSGLIAFLEAGLEEEASLLD
jgi:hypothetical protein